MDTANNNNNKLLYNGRSGIPQGSAASPLVCDLLLTSVLQRVQGDVQVFSHSDDFLILTRTKAEAVECKKALLAALQQHPAGPLEPKYAEIKRAADGFRYLGYDFKKRSGTSLAKPARKNMEDFKDMFYWRLAQLVENGKGERELCCYVQSWCQQFRQWPGHGLWRKIHLRKIADALEVREKVLDRLIEQAVQRTS